MCEGISLIKNKGLLMAEKLNPKQIVDFKELLISEVIQSEALINLPDKKGIINKLELLDE
jgi:hypothetical protein